MMPGEFCFIGHFFGFLKSDIRGFLWSFLWFSEILVALDAFFTLNYVYRLLQAGLVAAYALKALYFGRWVLAPSLRVKEYLFHWISETYKIKSVQNIICFLGIMICTTSPSTCISLNWLFLSFCCQTLYWSWNRSDGFNGISFIHVGWGNKSSDV